jgi:hypothetical protein
VYTTYRKGEDPSTKTFWSPVRPSGDRANSISNGILPQFAHERDSSGHIVGGFDETPLLVAEMTVPRGTHSYRGITAPQGGARTMRDGRRAAGELVGGGEQIIFSPSVRAKLAKQGLIRPIGKLPN